MSLDPRKMRELVLLLLYSIDASQKEISDDLIALVSRECKVSQSHVRHAAKRADEVMREIERCNEILSKTCHEYRIERIGSVERSIARLAIYDLVIEKKIPHKVAIAEAKRLTKKFGITLDEQPIALKEAYDKLSEDKE
jgi:N utilization substance protein B